MANLGPQHINLTYGGLLQLPSGSITSILQTVTDGFGNATGLQISSTGVAGTIISSSVLITGGSIDKNKCKLILLRDGKTPIINTSWNQETQVNKPLKHFKHYLKV